jgi:hypothetical protein
MHRADPEQQTRNAKDLCARGPVGCFHPRLMGHGYAVSFSFYARLVKQRLQGTET